MNRDTRTVDISRRRILKTIGVMSGAAVAAPIVPGFSGRALAGTASSLLTSGRSVTIGLLLPGSDMALSHAARLKAGLELALAQWNGRAGGRRIEVVTEDIGTGTGAAIRASRKLAQENADIVVGMVGTAVTHHVREIFEKSGTLFIEANAGEAVTRRDGQGAHIFHNSLGAWQSTMALGAWAARHLGGAGALVASFYDSGYDMLNAFRCGFENSGGRIVSTQITSSPRMQVTISDALAELGNVRPDFVFGLYSGAGALSFADTCRRMGIADRMPILTSGFAVDEYLLPSHGDGALGIRSAHTWAATLGSDANREFVKAYEGVNGERADGVALLGYETGLMIVNGLEQTGGDAGGTLAKALEGLTIESPRGRVTIDPKTHATIAPHYLREVQGRGSIGNQIVGELKPHPTQARMMHDLVEDSRSGWSHTHLSI